jgi:hypothetical protein
MRAKQRHPAKGARLHLGPGVKVAFSRINQLAA